MGINPLGSNKKARTTLVFDEKEERNDVKNALSDINTILTRSLARNGARTMGSYPISLLRSVFPRPRLCSR